MSMNAGWETLFDPQAFLMTLFYYFKLVKVKHRLSQARVTKRENGSIYGKKGADQTSKQFTFKSFSVICLG